MVQNLVRLASFSGRVVLLHLLHLVKAQSLIVCLYGKSILICLVSALKRWESRTLRGYSIYVLLSWPTHLHG
jgi:hypothetical protein